ncbi:MAG TPA: hypothetical protein VHE61_15060 [Opitutaceae bacterium]|nr:hypothetical protein [Opitutaceae bacterium]
MKNIGTTSSGTVIVEMTAKQFETLTQLHAPTASAPMSLSDKTAYAKERIAKLSPKKKDGVARSIRTMFQFTGGIADTEIETVITRLQNEKFFTIDDRGHVTYKDA